MLSKTFDRLFFMSKFILQVKLKFKLTHLQIYMKINIAQKKEMCREKG